MLDPLDKKIEAMGLPFARYADDCSGLLRIRSCRCARNLIVTRSKTRAIEVMEEVREYVEGKLKLLVNQDKSKVAPLGECDFLGFNVRGGRIRRTEKAAKRFKFRIQKITSRSRGISMRHRLLELKRYCVGWFHYFKIGLPYKEVREWDGWIRRRVRLCYWFRAKGDKTGPKEPEQDWKVPRKRRRMLIKLGVSPDEVKKASRARKGYWRMSQNSLVRLALNNTYLANQGVPSMRGLWVRFIYGVQAKV